MEDQTQVPAVPPMAEGGRALVDDGGVRPPAATRSAASLTLLIPRMGPTVTPWSMGMITVLSVSLLKILSILTDFPINGISPMIMYE